tara:strand:- start:496 stop:600 length:105 start_codon:yes stop_codon:yes gene_type:complete
MGLRRGQMRGLRRERQMDCPRGQLKEEGGRRGKG